MSTRGPSFGRITVEVTVAMDGSKFPLFSVSKGKTGGQIHSSLDAIYPAGVVRAVQEKAWID